jgi:hypothetical protein
LSIDFLHLVLSDKTEIEELNTSAKRHYFPSVSKAELDLLLSTFLYQYKFYVKQGVVRIIFQLKQSELTVELEQMSYVSTDL